MMAGRNHADHEWGGQNAEQLKRVSKLLAKMLRHAPEEFDLTLDEQGYTPVEPVFAAVQKRLGQGVTWNDLLAVVEGDKEGKKRYELLDGRIRAMYGHNANIGVIVYPAAIPPDLLYHGTTAAVLPAIRQSGLLSLGRQYVHLTTNPDRAIRVAQRRHTPIVMLHIRARAAHEAGVVFHHAETEHWLTKAVPAEYIEDRT